MLYAMSDIHGCIEALKKQMSYIDLCADNRIIFLGDYIDYGNSSCQVLQYLRELQEKNGEEKIVVLKGNHEQMFLEWLDDYGNSNFDETEDIFLWNDWLKTDFKYGAKTINPFISERQMNLLNQMSSTHSWETLNKEAARMIICANKELIEWLRKLPMYYETKTQIFVHAGVDEEAGEYWNWGTSDDILLGKFPAQKGKFYKTIIAGHIGTGNLAAERSYHDIYFDGESHYYIDGSVYKGGKLLLLAYDEKEDKYYQIENGVKRRIFAFEKL